VQEQAVPIEIELDGLDDAAIHFLAQDLTGKAIGCARLLTNGKLRRMAVLKSWRGKGVGRALLDFAIRIAEELGIAQLSLSAQTHAIAFYERAGFVAHGEIYEEAGIPHRMMRYCKALKDGQETVPFQTNSEH
jgi:predicted GNAT family N-acyltransferase